MEPKDKFGSPLYDHVFRKMVHYGWVLENKGYAEHERKQNLFVLMDRETIFYADMRGTEGVPIWKDQTPLFYWTFRTETPDWKKRRLIKAEMKRLGDAGCPTRLSFHETDEPNGLMVKEDDGYCAVCGKDYQAAGRFCSDECKEKSGLSETTSESALPPKDEVLHDDLLD